MDVRAFKKDNRTVYRLVGKVCTLDDYEVLQSLIRDNVKITSKVIVIDLSRITFISSQGLGSLVALSNSLRGSDINLFLFNPRGEIKSEIELAGINMVIPTAYSEDELDKMVALRKSKKR